MLLNPGAKSLAEARTWREVRESVHFGAIGKESDDITQVVNTVDERTHDAKSRRLRRTWGVKLRESPPVVDEPVYVPIAIGEGTDHLTLVIAAKRRGARGNCAVDLDIETKERLAETPKETVIVAIGIRPEAAHIVVIRDVAGLGRNGAGKG